MSQTDLHSRLARWSIKLQGFNFKIEHRRGRLNVVPDALSRVNLEELAAIDACLMLKSGEYIELQEKISANSYKFPDLRIAHGLLYRRTDHATGDLLYDTFAWKLWIPSELVPEVLKKAHDDPLASHGGVHKTLERIRRYYFWPRLVTDVKEYIGNCDIYRKTKAPNRVQWTPIGIIPESQRCFQRLYIGFLGPYPRSHSGNLGIFIVLDHYSMFGFADVVVKYLQQELFRPLVCLKRSYRIMAPSLGPSHSKSC